ncbi:hypothetical protein B0H11DRAFT_2254057 [Mycena galericulata]|nr:hypothetical protein B0H11DRAFT_2254057 [Mycena galericulata]
MDVKSAPPVVTGVIPPLPPGACQPGTNHSLNYYWKDGTMFISPDKSTTIYCVWGSRLERYSAFFQDLASLPQPTDNTNATELASESKKPVDVVKKLAKSTGGEGLSENSPLWIQATAYEFEVFLECVFLEINSDMTTRPVEFWQTALSLADFFDAAIVRDIAIRGLDVLQDFDPFLRLSLAIQYNILDWVEIAFRYIIRIPLPSLSSNQIDTIGFSPYIILAEAHSKITSHRLLCSLTAPPVVHSDTCTDFEACNNSWARTWWGELKNHGIAVALIHPRRLPAKRIVKSLHSLVTSWHMSASCRTLTVRSLMGFSSILLREELYISRAVKALQHL